MPVELAIPLALVALVLGAAGLWYGWRWRRAGRAAAAAQARAEAEFRTLHNLTPVPLHSLDADDRFVSVSDYWLALMGYTREEVIGRKLEEFMTPASVRYRREVLQPRFLVENEVHDVEYEFVKKSGEPVDVLLSSRIHRDPDGRFLRTFTVLVDVTARKRAEQALRDRIEEHVEHRPVLPDEFVGHLADRPVTQQRRAPDLDGETP